MADYCNEKDPTNKKVLDFIRAHIAEAQAVADELGVHVESILGLSATESGYGTSAIAREANNFFGLHAGAPGSIGTYTTSKGVKVAKFTNYKASAESFSKRFGDLIRGKQNSKDFVDGLIPKFNTADSKTGGNPNFKKDTLGGIDGVSKRICCKQIQTHKCGAACKDFKDYGYCDRKTRKLRCWQHS